MPSRTYIDKNGIEYSSFGAICAAHNLSPSTVQNRIQKKGMTLLEALEFQANGQNTIGKTCTDHLGNTYNSVAAMCAAYSITRRCYYNRLRSNWSQEKALTTPLSKNEWARRCKRLIKDHLGNKYDSCEEMCAAYGINNTDYYRRIRAGWSIEKALTTPDDEFIQMGKKQCVDHLGNIWPSQTAMCKHYGVTKMQIRSRIELGWTLEEILTHPEKKSTNKECTDHLGNKFKSQKDMYAYWGVSESIYKRRIRVMGLSQKEALETKNFHIKEYDDPVGNHFNSLQDMLKYWNVSNGCFLNFRMKNKPLEERLINIKPGMEFDGIKVIMKKRKSNYWMIEKNNTISFISNQTLCLKYLQYADKLKKTKT